jgi:hypothetical protein
MKRFFILFILPVLVAAMFSACKGDDGEDGIDGTNGQNGQNGATGTANVIYSDWMTLAGSWRDTTLLGSKLLVKHMIAPEVTDNVVNNGVVLCYFRNYYLIGREYSPVYQLPYTGYDNGLAYTMSDFLRTGKIFISCFTEDNSATDSPSELAVTNYFRYIVIPGGVAATKSTEDYESMSYEEICSRLGIPE